MDPSLSMDDSSSTYTDQSPSSNSANQSSPSNYSNQSPSSSSSTFDNYSISLLIAIQTVSVGAIMVNVFCLWVIKRAAANIGDLGVILNVSSVTSITCALLLLSKTCYYFWLWGFLFETDAEIYWTIWQCSVTELPINGSFAFRAVSELAVVLDRYLRFRWATKQGESYQYVSEPAPSHLRMTMCIVFIPFVFVFVVNNAIQLWVAFHNEDQPSIVWCTVASIQSLGAVWTMKECLILGVNAIVAWALVSFERVLRQNERLMNAFEQPLVAQNLNMRIVLKETYGLSKGLKYSVRVTLLLAVFNLALVVLLNNTQPTTNQLNVLITTQLAVALYTLIPPICLLTSCRQLREKVPSFQKNKVAASVNDAQQDGSHIQVTPADHEQQLYFDSLIHKWSSAYSQKQRHRPHSKGQPTTTRKGQRTTTRKVAVGEAGNPTTPFADASTDVIQSSSLGCVQYNTNHDEIVIINE